jgi:uncharacterized protein
MADERVIVFLKAPRAGEVKTRLAKTLGPDAACAAYRQLAERLWKELAHLPGGELRFSPDDAASEIQSWLGRSWPARPQGDGDLGQRMQAAFADAFADGATRVVIVGADCPQVTAADVRQAWNELKSHDVVLGPAMDGGYWLIGLARPQAALFQGITWSSDKVLGQTLQRARTAGLRIQLLRILSDVDTERDWKGFLDSSLD